MVRAHLARVALLAALGLAAGCSTPSSCSSCSGSSFTSRLTGLFRHDRGRGEVVSPGFEGPVIGDPGVMPESPGCAPGFAPGFSPGFSPMPQMMTPQTIAPPLVPTPPPASGLEARRMPYQP
jgi:hypothetical protein